MPKILISAEVSEFQSTAFCVKPGLVPFCQLSRKFTSTVARRLAAQDNAVILSYDSIREELYGPDGKKPNDSEIFRILRAKFGEALDSGRDVVIDFVNAVPSIRKGYAVTAKKRGYKTVCVFCHKHCAYAITANMARGVKYPSYIIKGMFDKFVPPEKHEGWDEIRVMDGNRYSLEVEGQIPVERRNLRYG